MLLFRRIIAKINFTLNLCYSTDPFLKDNFELFIMNYFHVPFYSNRYQVSTFLIWLECRHMAIYRLIVHPLRKMLMALCVLTKIFRKKKSRFELQFFDWLTFLSWFSVSLCYFYLHKHSYRIHTCYSELSSVVKMHLHACTCVRVTRFDETWRFSCQTIHFGSICVCERVRVTVCASPYSVYVCVRYIANVTSTTIRSYMIF